MIGAVVFGELADRIGLRPVLIIVTLIYGLMTLATPGIDGTAGLAMVRFFRARRYWRDRCCASC